MACHLNFEHVTSHMEGIKSVIVLLEKHEPTFLYPNRSNDFKWFIFEDEIR